MVSSIVLSCRKEPSELNKVQIFEKCCNKSDYAADGTLMGGNPNAIKQNTEAVLRCKSSVYFTNSHFVLGSVVLGYLCNPV
jgi:hypothetical protein